MAAREELDAPGSMFATTTAEVRGVQMKVFAAAPPSMRMLWELSAGYADNEYLVYEDERYTYGEIHRQVRVLAQYLQSQGVTRGSRVAVSMRNYPEWVVSYWATVSLGAALVGMNAWWTASEMEFALSDSEPTVLIVDGERLARFADIENVRPVHLVVARHDGPLPTGAAQWASVLSGQDPGALPAVEIDPEDDATIFYTSGTTGFPKGAQLTNRGSVSNVLNIAAMTAATALAEQKAIEAGDVEAPSTPPLTPSSVIFAPTPLFHVTACNCLLHPATLTGAKVVMMYKWDAGRALELIEREKVTTFSGVPTMGRELLLHPDWETRDTSSLQSMGGGGSAIQPDLVEKISNALKGGQPSTGYGMTETCGIITANAARFYRDRPESCGPLVPTLEGKLVDEDGNDLPRDPNTVGILCVKGAVTIAGYLNRPEATAEAIKDGWLNTGDVARIDADGFVYIVDRAKDMVIRGGENVYCSEVESAIYKHPAIAEAAVFGIPDERMGEEVGAAILLRPNMTVSESELRDFLAQSIAKHKIPSRLWFRDEPIPRNATGKFLKRELRKELIGE